MRFALAHPSYLRVMFGAEVPDKAMHPGLQEAGGRTFGLLVEAITEYHEVYEIARRYGGPEEGGMAKTTKKEREHKVADALGYLREQLDPNAQLYFVCVYRSTKGYSTHGYRVFVAENDPSGPYIRDITFLVGRATETYREASEDIRVTGCGFSKPQHVVDLLRARLGGAYSASGYSDDRRRDNGLTYTM